MLVVILRNPKDSFLGLWKRTWLYYGLQLNALWNINNLNYLLSPNNQLPLFNGTKETNLEKYINNLPGISYKDMELPYKYKTWLMAYRRVSKAFKDISLSFSPHPVTKDLPILKNERAISRSVRNIVETIPTEKFFNPNFGSDVYKSLFDFVDFGTAAVIEDQILTSIRNFEPRVENVTVEVDPRPDDNDFEVTVIFDIVGQEFPTQEYTFILEATR